MLINVKIPTIVGILTFMSRINFVLSWVGYKKSVITSVPDQSSMGALYVAKDATFSGGKRRLYSNCADVQTDFNLHCRHMPTCILCWIPAQLIVLLCLVFLKPSPSSLTGFTSATVRLKSIIA